MLFNDITLSTTPQKVLTPAPAARLVYLQNNSNVDIRFSYDGINRPTSSKGALLRAYQDLWIPLGNNAAFGQTIQNKPLPEIWACAASATATLVVSTDDYNQSTSP